MTHAPPEGVVLVVADQDDLSSDKVVLAVAATGGDVVRLSPRAVPLHMDCRFRDGRWQGTIQAGTGREVHLDRVTAVLWRWGVTATMPGHPDIAGTAERAWAASEDRDGLLGVLRSLPAYWMSHPDAIAAVEYSKPLQLRDAVRVGLTVPDTLIATRGAAAATWMDPSVDHIYKAFRAPFRPTAQRNQIVLARRITEDVPDELGAASIFQRLIPGTPIRLTVIGTEMHAAAIHADGDVDWRLHQLDPGVLTPVRTPDRIRALVSELMGHWGLTYGAWDFIATEDDWVFLEINPTGLWGFVEEATGLPLTDRIAAVLLSGGARCA
ncbi:MAG: ATP-grasp ribosomal peptide maturase [Streptosporangiaceae bacterium]|nr:ATP-grasp ribosomal peptide maturase [Streptosporangiaceae bacterium]